MSKDIDLKKLAKELDIDVPIMAARVVGDRVELHLYGGQVRVWQEKVEESEPTKAPKAKAKPKAKP
jgi:hypothetical protein